MGSRNRQRQIWADAEFKDRLEKLHAKALLNGKRFNNLGDLTREIVNVPAFEEVERQIIDEGIRRKLGVKFDKEWR